MVSTLMLFEAKAHIPWSGYGLHESDQRGVAKALAKGYCTEYPNATS